MAKFSVLVICVVAAFLVAESSATPGSIGDLTKVPWRFFRNIIIGNPCAKPAPAAPPAAAMAYDEDAVAAFGFEEDEVASSANATVPAAGNTASDANGAANNNNNNGAPTNVPTAPAADAAAAADEVPADETPADAPAADAPEVSTHRG